ncbi:MAG: hypothetical protein DHS20C15_27140 [Planctomycetota bacterium]|nr:MAG: hypothetical protein DHS20C15_27140 [Planctomycetota bacterium]
MRVRDLCIAAALLGALGSFTPRLCAQVRWDTWWRNHELEFLWGSEPWSVQTDVSAMRGGGLRGGSSGPVSGGRSSTPGGRQVGAVTVGGSESVGPATLRRGFAYGRIVPVLLELAEHDDLRMRRQAVRALGRVVEPRFARLISDSLRARLEDKSTGVRAEAAFALGMVYDPENGPDLLAIAADSTAGRRLVGGEHISDRVRRGALAGLSAANDARIVPQLLALYESMPEKQISLRRAAILALGHGSAERAPQVAAIFEEQLRDPWVEPLLRTQLATALGHLGQRSSIPVLLEVLDEDTHDPRIQQSCLIGLGDLAEASDVHVIQRLLDATVDEKDPDSRRYALLSAARVLARDLHSDSSVESHVLFVRTLLEEMDSPRHRDDNPHHALAAGIYLRPHRVQAPKLEAQLIHDVNDFKDPENRGAYALALGLGGLESSGELLLELFQDNKDQLFRAECALALGFVRYEAATRDLRQVFEQRGLHPRLLELAGTALMLIGDDESADVLLQRLIKSGNYEERLGLVDALANYRNERVAERILELLDDDKLDTITHIGLCAALGKLATWRSLPHTAEYAVSRNLGPRNRKLDGLLDTPLDKRGALDPELEEEEPEEEEAEDAAAEGG